MRVATQGLPVCERRVVKVARSAGTHCHVGAMRPLLTPTGCIMIARQLYHSSMENSCSFRVASESVKELRSSIPGLHVDRGCSAVRPNTDNVWTEGSSLLVDSSSSSYAHRSKKYGRRATRSTVAHVPIVSASC
jgi:hypothetical protein